MKKTLIALLILALCLTASLSLADGKLDSIQAAGKLVMGTDAAWPPFEYIGANGDPAGSDIEIGAYIAAQLGVELEVKNIAFDSLSTALMSDEIDVAIAAMTITEERKDAVDFSVPYTNAQQYIIVNDDNDTVKVLDDLAGQAIGVHLGTTGDFLVSDAIMLDSGVLYNSGASVQQYKFLTDACLALKNGELSAIVCDTLLAKNLVAVNDGLKCFELAYADGSSTIEEYGIAMKKGDEAFVAKVNELLQTIIDDGSVDKWILEHTEKAAEIN
ncbi:MAG: transporter substrate-binding domain-containing protein [Clostridia bacterium]|nr:transporter substrate-binding domain-containing protein [Clostridia bacterium]